MKIIFAFLWSKESSKPARAFQSVNYFNSVSDYLKRLSPWTSCEMRFSENLIKKIPSDAIVWVCDRSSKSTVKSSEDIAKSLQSVLDIGGKELWILVGGANGLSEETLREVSPRERWSFGPLTLPHELAAVVAVEQIYRGFSILQNHPYHLGH